MSTIIENKGFPLGSTKVLTLGGWKYFDELVVGEDVLSYDKRSNEIVVDTLLGTSLGTSGIHKLYHKNLEVSCGKDQKWYGWKRTWAKQGEKRGKEFLTFSIPETTQEFNLISTAPYKGVGKNPSFTEQDGCLWGWILSDGYYKWKPDTKRTSSSFGKKRGVVGLIAQAQHKFYKEVEEAITGAGLGFYVNVDNTGNKTSPVNKYNFYAEEFRAYIDSTIGERLPKSDINWVGHMLSWDYKTIDQFLYSFWLADGTTKGLSYCGNKMLITQNKGTVYDAVELAMFLKGRRVSSSIKQNTTDFVCCSIRMLKNAHITLQETSFDRIGHAETFSVDTNQGTYIIKQGDFISITCS